MPGSDPAPTAALRPVVLSSRDDERVLLVGDTVIKTHHAGTVAAELARRLAVAADPGSCQVLLAPRPVTGGGLGGLAARLGGQWLTVWPAGAPLGPGSGATVAAMPWDQAGRLLAALHRLPAPADLPAASGPARVGRALRRLEAARGEGLSPRDRALAAIVAAAARTLPAWALRAQAAPVAAGQRRAVLCHGDWHLGQLVRLPRLGWRLIDVDDLGLGDPAWDLARPAAWFAAGLLPSEEFGRFLGAYLAAGGPAVAADSDPWPVLEIPARAVTVQAAAIAVAKAAADRAAGGPGRLDEAGAILVGCCRRMDRLARDPAN
ncbi:MAG: aminoglycoside phosphotransferase family protein [Micromonosporaceae bacterium]|nr:aminoglycoside phosphotransferase family protein [Micromonosporaceae bacterium]